MEAIGENRQQSRLTDELQQTLLQSGSITKEQFDKTVEKISTNIKKVYSDAIQNYVQQLNGQLESQEKQIGEFSTQILENDQEAKERKEELAELHGETSALKEGLQNAKAAKEALAKDLKTQAKKVEEFQLEVKRYQEVAKEVAQLPHDQCSAKLAEVQNQRKAINGDTPQDEADRLLFKYKIELLEIKQKEHQAIQEKLKDSIRSDKNLLETTDRLSDENIAGGSQDPHKGLLQKMQDLIVGLFRTFFISIPAALIDGLQTIGSLIVRKPKQ